MILNQDNSGKACPKEVRTLTKKVPRGSLMCFVNVHALALAKVLDRLEALERFQKETLAAGLSLRRLSRNPKGNRNE